MQSTLTNFDLGSIQRHLFVKSPKEAKARKRQSKNIYEQSGLNGQNRSIEIPIGNMLLSVHLRDIA
jgi:hypothetical protein